MKRALYIVLFLAITAVLHSSVCINEVMFAPDGEEPEWVELFNNSASEAALDNWTISDAASTKAMPVIILPSYSYCVITKDTTALKALRSIPSNAALVQMTLPVFNNTTESVIIRDKSINTIDSVYYNGSWGKICISIERIESSKPAIDISNWASSISSTGATPGAINSVSSVEYDVAATSARLISGNSFEITIKNLGKSGIEDAGFTLYLSSSKENLLKPENAFKTASALIIAEGGIYSEKIEYNDIRTFIANAATVYYCLVAQSEKNFRKENDTLAGSFSFSPEFATVRINEFMFDPDSSGAEFIELFNTGTQEISLTGWSLHDRPGKYGYDSVLIIESFAIQPKGYVAICWDSAFCGKYPDLVGSTLVYFKKSAMNLNAGDDEIYLIDENGIVQDSLSYSSGWHSKLLSETKGISLEKIHTNFTSNSKESWTSCSATLGATPTVENSIAVDIKPSGNVWAEPNPFSPFEGSDKPLCSISYKLSFKKAFATAKIFRTDGAEVMTLLNNVEISSDGTFQWDGRNREGYVLPIGAYILVFEAADAADGSAVSENILLVIGK
jgi:hypothetical protein